MAVCDVCNKPGTGSPVSSEEMRKAVFTNGFNPFRLGLAGLEGVMNLLGLDEEQAFREWKDRLSRDNSDWNVCPNCITILKKYLDPTSLLLDNNVLLTVDNDPPPITAPLKQEVNQPKPVASPITKPDSLKRIINNAKILAEDVQDLADHAFSNPGPLFNEQRREIFTKWFSNFSRNLKAVITALQTGKDMAGNTIRLEKVAGGLGKMCNEYGKMVQRLEEVCGQQVRLKFEGFLKRASDLALDIKKEYGQERNGEGPPVPPKPMGENLAAPQNLSVKPFPVQPPKPKIETSQTLQLELDEAAKILDRGAGHLKLSTVVCAVLLLISLAIHWILFLVILIPFVVLLIFYIAAKYESKSKRVLSILSSICAKHNLGEQKLVPHLPTRLANTPDVLEGLDEKGFKQEMDERLHRIEEIVQWGLSNPKCVNEAAVNAVLARHGEGGLNQDIIIGGNIISSRIQAIDLVGKIISEQHKNIISARMKRAGQYMMDNIGETPDPAALLKLGLAHADNDMTLQWARFYVLYGILGGGLLKASLGWPWEDAIDTVMGWPGDLRPFLGLSAFLQGFFLGLDKKDRISPRIVAGRVMCWIYAFPDRVETLRHCLEMATVHQGTITDLQGLKEPWRSFAKEIVRLSLPLRKDKRYMNDIPTLLELCAKI